MREWTLEISNKHHWYDVDIKGLWRYRDLYWMYVKRDIIVVYKQTVFGPLWFLIQPVLTTIMYMFVFGGLAGISTDGVPQPLFYMSGIMLWSYFSGVFLVSSTLFTSNASVFGKVYFPRLVVPLANATSALLKFFIQFLMFVAIYVFYLIIGTDAHLTWAAVLLPILLLTVAFLAMSTGLVVASMTVKYRDLTQLVSFGVQLYMYATPVIYPLSAAPEKYKQIIMLNPLSSIFEALRYGLMGCGELSWGGLAYALAFTIAITAVSFVVFSKTERNFMDTV